LFSYSAIQPQVCNTVSVSNLLETRLENQFYDFEASLLDMFSCTLTFLVPTRLQTWYYHCDPVRSRAVCVLSALRHRPTCVCRARFTWVWHRLKFVCETVALVCCQCSGSFSFNGRSVGDYQPLSLSSSSFTVMSRKTEQAPTFNSE